MIPEFAILGHPNEGKSSVLSTLAEDDSVRVSQTPGETIECRSFPVIIDGHEILRFTDTPGFQNPAQMLSEMRKMMEMEGDPITALRHFAATVPGLHDDWELLAPVERGAGIIYVADGSRPMRNVDKMEMEILRLTGKPRMAILNCKEEEGQYLEEWKREFRKNFNASRSFNAHRATYAERILLLEALKAIDQDWHPALTRVVDAFQKDWMARSEACADRIIAILEDCLSLQLHCHLNSDADQQEAHAKLLARYGKRLAEREEQGFTEIRRLYKHNIFNYRLPSYSLLHDDLLDEKTWQLLGLTARQTLIAASLGGAAIGAGLDVAALGHGLGLFTAMGGVAGAMGAIWGGKDLVSKARFMGIQLGSNQLRIGPAKDMSLMLVLLNRALLYYRHTINWAHGRRDYNTITPQLPRETRQQGFTSQWSVEKIRICNSFFASLRKATPQTKDSLGPFKKLLIEVLTEISEDKSH